MLRIYLDENVVSQKILGLLKQHGFKPLTPQECDLVGAPDQAQFNHARQKKLPILTKDAGDFLLLHQKYPKHAGIIVIYEEADTSKNMSVAEIVRALENLRKNGGSLGNRFVILNQFRK